jgi:hypothetical protein
MIIPKPILRGTKDEQFDQLVRYVDKLVDLLNTILLKEKNDAADKR